MPIAANQPTEFIDDITPETSIRVMDQTLVDWLTGLRFRSQSPRVVTAWMSKQFSQKKELQSDLTQKTAMPFPMISLTVGSIVPDLERRQFNSILSTKDGRIYIDPDRETYYKVPWPLPINIPYQIDIWTKTRQDLRLLETAILSRFNFSDMTYLEAEFPGYGKKLLRIILDSVDDTSDLETGEEERELRKTVSTTLEGWIFRKPEVGKVIKKSHVVVFDAGSKTVGNPDEGNLLKDQDFLDYYCDLDNYNFGVGAGTITSITESPSYSPPNRAILWVSFDETGLVDVGGQ